MSTSPSATKGVKLSDPPSFALDYILLYAYPAAFLGAIFFSVNSFMNIQPMSAFANNHIVLALNIYVAVAGAVSILYWFEYSNIPPVTAAIQATSSIYNINTIKQTSSS
jgi:hypothetical protein